MCCINLVLSASFVTVILMTAPAVTTGYSKVWSLWLRNHIYDKTYSFHPFFSENSLCVFELWPLKFVDGIYKLKTTSSVCEDPQSRSFQNIFLVVMNTKVDHMSVIFCHYPVFLDCNWSVFFCNSFLTF
jgi:hypothetical protein